MGECAYVVELHTSWGRGDHAADVVIAFQPKSEEKVRELVDRTIQDGDWSDYIVIRRVRKETP